MHGEKENDPLCIINGTHCIKSQSRTDPKCQSSRKLMDRFSNYNCEIMKSWSVKHTDTVSKLHGRLSSRQIGGSGLLVLETLVSRIWYMAWPISYFLIW